MESRVIHSLGPHNQAPAPLWELSPTGGEATSLPVCRQVRRRPRQILTALTVAKLSQQMRDLYRAVNQRLAPEWKALLGRGEQRRKLGVEGGLGEHRAFHANHGGVDWDQASSPSRTTRGFTSGPDKGLAVPRAIYEVSHSAAPLVNLRRLEDGPTQKRELGVRQGG